MKYKLHVVLIYSVLVISNDSEVIIESTGREKKRKKEILLKDLRAYVLSTFSFPSVYSSFV